MITSFIPLPFPLLHYFLKKCKSGKCRFLAEMRGEEELKADETLQTDKRSGRRGPEEEIRSFQRHNVLPFFFNRFTVVVGWVVYLLLVFSLPYIFQYFNKESTPITLNFTLLKKKLSHVDPFAPKRTNSSSSSSFSRMNNTLLISNSNQTSLVTEAIDQFLKVITIPFKIIRFLLFDVPKMLMKKVCNMVDSNDDLKEAMNIRLEL